MDASWGILGRLGSILGCLSEFRAVLGASWEYFGPSGKRLGVVLEASWIRLGDVLGRRGPSWTSRGRLGSILEVSCARFSIQRGLDLGMLSWMPFFN